MIQHIFKSLSAVLAVSNIIEYKIYDRDTEIVEPVDNVSVIMASLNEEKNIKRAITSIRNQDIVQMYSDKFEFILADSHSTDNTIEIANPYFDKIINVPKGKLTSRNIATDNAKNNIIVATDSDAYYPDGWLNSLLKPFHQHDVIAVHGSNIDYGITYLGGKLFTIIHPLYIMFLSPYEMNGGNSAYYKHAFYLSGRFNESINQLNSKIIQKEEEVDFGYRLSKLGKVVYKLNAPKIHLGGDRVLCRFGIGDNSFCNTQKIGIERFGGI